MRNSDQFIYFLFFYSRDFIQKIPSENESSVNDATLTNDSRSNKTATPLNSSSSSSQNTTTSSASSNKSKQKTRAKRQRQSDRKIDDSHWTSFWPTPTDKSRAKNRKKAEQVL